MAKRFAVVHANERTEFTARQYIDAKYFALRFVNAYGYEGCDEITFVIDNVKVSAKDFVEACEQSFEDWYDAKCKTHKRVRVLHGSSVACYVWKWVQK